jgi:hypothetical protein
MTRRITPRFGINELLIGDVHIITLRIRVKSTFSLDGLPRQVKVVDSMDKKGQHMYMITYTAVMSPEAKSIVANVGALLYQHALNQLEEKYSWITNC